jgi:hypothetical protein
MRALKTESELPSLETRREEILLPIVQQSIMLTDDPLLTKEPLLLLNERILIHDDIKQSFITDRRDIDPNSLSSPPQDMVLPTRAIHRIDNALPE